MDGMNAMVSGQYNNTTINHLQKRNNILVKYINDNTVQFYCLVLFITLVLTNSHRRQTIKQYYPHFRRVLCNY